MNKENKAIELVKKIKALNICCNPTINRELLCLEIALKLAEELSIAEAERWLSKDNGSVERDFFGDFYAAIKIAITEGSKGFEQPSDFEMCEIQLESFLQDKFFAPWFRGTVIQRPQKITVGEVKKIVIKNRPELLAPFKSEKSKEVLLRKVIKSVGLKTITEKPGRKSIHNNY